MERNPRSCWKQGLRVLILVVGLALGLAPSAASAQLANARAATAQAGTRVPLVPLPTFAPLVQKVLPTVVSLAVRVNPAATPGAESEGGIDEGVDAPVPFEDLLRRFFGQEPSPGRDRTALGSGFVIDSAGYIVTGNHVVADAESIVVTFQDGSERSAHLVGRDALTDLALLKVAADRPLASAEWGDSDTAQVGDWALAIGNSFGLGGTVSPGVISGRERDLHSGPYDAFLQVDASVNRGNSGGPLFSLEGQVIGITTAIYTPSGGSVGIAFAIPANLARPVIAELRTHGRVIRGWLGLQFQELTPALAKSLGAPRAEGALVTDVVENGPAARAGFRRGDVILSFEGRAIEKAHDLPLLVAEVPPGRQAAVIVWRKDREVTLSPVIGEMPETSSAALKEGRQSYPRGEGIVVMGLTLAPLTSEARELFHVPYKVRGVLVLGIADDSPFADLDIARGDVIVTIDQESVATPREAAAKLKALGRRRGDSIPILLNRAGSGRFIALKIEGAPSKSG